MKSRWLALLIVVLGGASTGPSAEYPNELRRFQAVRQNTVMASNPMRSTVEDVKKVLGKPTRAMIRNPTGEPFWFERIHGTVWPHLPGQRRVSSRSCRKEGPVDRLHPRSSRFLVRKQIKFLRRYSIRPMSLPPTHDGTNTDDAFGLTYEVYTSNDSYGHERPGDSEPNSAINRPPQDHRRCRRSMMIETLKKAAAKIGPRTAAISFDTYSGYFVSNKFEPNAAESFVVITDQKQFDEVFSVAFVMGDNRIGCPRTPSSRTSSWRRSNGAKQSGSTRSMASRSRRPGQPALHRHLEESDSATFACPLIVSIPKGITRRFNSGTAGRR